MRLLILLLALHLPSLFVQAQKNLSGALQHSALTKIYKITDLEAKKLSRAGLVKANDQYLHSLVDSFPTYEEIPPLAAGNYLLVFADRNKLKYKLHTVGDVKADFISNLHDLSVFVHDRQGNIIRDADVAIGRRSLSFNASTGAYGPVRWKKSSTAHVIYQNAYYAFPVKITRPYQMQRGFLGRLTSPFRRRQTGYRSYFDDQTPYEKKFKGFLAFSKPKYRPGDTVRVKAFVETNGGKFLSRPLILRLTDNSFTTDTILSVVRPYRAGAYAFEFVLNDSLDILLDDDYLLTLEEGVSRKYDVNEYYGDLDDDDYAMKRKVLMRGKFSYEDYELNQITFTARSDKETHSRNVEASVYLKAVDENNLPVLDGRVEILLLPQPYGSMGYHEPKVFVPDTLWRHLQVLENPGETRIVIPDSVFPRASFDYRVICNFRNANNELHTETLTQHFRDEKKIVEFVQEGDSLFMRYLDLGRDDTLRGDLYIFNKAGDTIAKRNAQLPAAVKINAFESRFEFVAADLDNSFDVHEADQLVDCSFRRNADSVYIDIRNCCGIKNWYTIFAGNKVVARGLADSVSFHEKSVTRKDYFVALQYVFGGRLYEGNYAVPFQNKSLNVRVNQPDRIEPGQTAKIAIAVSDSRGKPVPNTDVTAYAVTGKFGSTVPVVPYLGKVYPYRRPLIRAEDGVKSGLETEKILDWTRWSRDLHLDTMEYYHFLYPQSVYINAEAAPDSITQIAPFVVSKGEVQPVQFLYIDEVPVFFVQSQDVNRYSFEVRPGKHSIRMRTPKKMVSLDSVFVEKGKKTFLSVNSDTVSPRVKIAEMSQLLTEQEVNLWKKYLVVIENTFGDNTAYIQQQKKFFLLNNGIFHRENILVGPLRNADARYVVKGRFGQDFRPEGAWHYNIIKGLIKQKWYEKGVPFNRYTTRRDDYNFRDYVMTQKEIDSLWQEYLDYRSSKIELFPNKDARNTGDGRLIVGFPDTLKTKIPFVKNVILFRKNNPYFIRVYPGETTDLGYQLAGDYRVFVLLKRGRYFLIDNVQIKYNGTNYYAINPVDVHLPDKMSDSIQHVIESRIVFSGPGSIDLDKIRRTFNNKYFDESLLTEFISGVVVDEQGAPIPGATVSIKGTSYGTSTDVNGTFAMKSPSQGVLVISVVGYEMRELAIQTSTSYTIVLPAMSNNLQEVVVTAFGVAKKRASYFNALTEVQGKVAGVQIRLRGMASIRPDSQALPLPTIPPREIKEEAGIPASSMRRNFRDDAFWLPRLSTDVDGKTSFTVRFPDDITNWNTHVVAMAGDRQTGSHNGVIRAYRSISGNIALPMFAVAGDSMNVIGKALNYLSEPAQLNRKFYINDELQTEAPISFRNSWIDTFTVHVPQLDSLNLKYVVTRGDGYYDGEERKIPVFKPGVLETNGIFAALNGDTSLRYTPSSDTGVVKIYAETSLLPVLEKEAEHIRDYAYLCNEQLASKLKAMLALKKVREYLHQPFRGEADISKLISKLNQNKHSSGLWGWWQGNEPSIWISLHAIEALLAAEKAGYSVFLNKQVLSDYLIYNLESENGYDKLRVIEILFRLQSKADLKKYVDSLARNQRPVMLYDQLRLVLLKQELGMPVTIDSFLTRASKTAFGNVYWGEDTYRFFDNSIQNTIEMYRVLKNAGGHESMLRAIRNYFLEKRKSGYWRNTYESSLILETILPDVLAESRGNMSVSLSLKYADSVTVTTFPFSMAVKSPGNINVKKRGGLPVYFTAYQQQWNSSPVKLSGNFEVQTIFLKDGRTSLLKAGTPVTMVVKVDVKADADYVMIEVPVPAGCSYASKEQSFANNEVHREYFRNKVSIFCRSLVKGKYEFSVALLPRYTGVYTLNPAKAEMMYFPVFSGREALKKIAIHPGDL